MEAKYPEEKNINNGVEASETETLNPPISETEETQTVHQPEASPTLSHIPSSGTEMNQAVFANAQNSGLREPSISPELLAAKQAELEKLQESYRNYERQQQALEEKLRAKSQHKEARKMAKRIRREEKRKARALSSPYRGYRSLTVFFLVISFLASTLTGAYISYYVLLNYLGFEQVNPNQVSHVEAPKTTANKEVKLESSGGEGSASVQYSTAEIANQAVPAVAAILTSARVDTFFGEREIEGAGSGVIIDPKGYVVTNNHVIEGASTITVLLASGDKLEASIVESDPDQDIALLKLPEAKAGKSYPYIEMADSESVTVGERAIAIGNPLGNLEGTVTQGIVSATGRTVTTQSELSGRTVTIDHALQTDASINSGNSGGALLNAEGKLIGINVIKASRTASGAAVDGIGFAIPSNRVREISAQFIDYDENGHPSIGIVGRSITAEMGEPFGIPAGVYVREVVKNSSADRAGLQAKDVIIEFDGTKVESVADMNRIKLKHSVGDKLTVKYYRNGEEGSCEIELERRPAQ
ncbi:MAG: trypsin-like peptidase domain-containing protein [Eubacteriales bacterium]|nr:trypsin-like peptidase domain-containing protein [Eubacteriales bacterium]